MTADQFLDLIVSLIAAVAVGSLEVRYAVIPATYNSGRPTLRFEGETGDTVATYPRLASYLPVPGDRVAVIVGGASGFILGKLV